MKCSLIFSSEYMRSANGSNAIAKSMGDRGQPWRIPLPLQKVGETWGNPDKFPYSGEIAVPGQTVVDVKLQSAKFKRNY
jgi:hypothetical protein